MSEPKYEPMRLWLLEPTKAGAARITWDCFLGFVVRAISEERARELVPGHGDEGIDFWQNPELSYCRVIETTRQPEEVILESFHAG